MTEPTVHALSGDEVHVWMEAGGPICLEAVTKEGDPVELTTAEARELARILLAVADEIDAKG